MYSGLLSSCFQFVAGNAGIGFSVGDGRKLNARTSIPGTFLANRVVEFKKCPG
jgi:hypothetical protein